MSLPSADHQFWGVLKILVVSVSLGLMLALSYRQGFDMDKDGRTMLTVLASLISISGLKHMFAGEKEL